MIEFLRRLNINTYDIQWMLGGILQLRGDGVLCLILYSGGKPPTRLVGTHSTGPSMAMALFQSRRPQVQLATISPVIGLDLAM